MGNIHVIQKEPSRKILMPKQNEQRQVNAGCKVQSVPAVGSWPGFTVLR